MESGGEGASAQLGFTSIMAIKITACMAVRAVVKTNCQSNGNGRVTRMLPPLASKPPERVSVELGIYNYIVDMTGTTTTTIVLRPFVWDYPGELVPEETLTHPPSSSSSNLYQLLPSTTIHSILPVEITCLAIFLHNLFPCPLWSTTWSGALHLIFHTFLHSISVFFSQHMPIPSQLVLL